MTRLYFNGLPGHPAIDGWERANIVSVGQLPGHPVAAPDGTRSPRLIVAYEPKYIDTLSLNKVLGCQGGLGLQRQAALLAPIREKYPDAHITTYGLPYCTHGWKCLSGKIEIAWQVWTGKVGEAKDRANMERAAKLVGDLLCGETPTAAAMKPIHLDGLSPSLYATDPDNSKCIQMALMELALAQFIDEYVYAKHNRKFSIVPFVRARRALGALPFLDESSFELTQIGPVRRANPDGVYYWSDDGVRIASAMDPMDEAHDTSLASVRQDVPAELLDQPIQWNAVQEWYNDRHVTYMNQVVEGLRQP